MIKELSKLLTETKEQMFLLAKQKEHLEESILNALQADISSQLDGKDYGCGTATIEREGVKVKVVVSKKVRWDNEILTGIKAAIIAAGHDPDLYMKSKHEILEASYKNWPKDIQKTFEPARDVSPSKPTISIEEI